MATDWVKVFQSKFGKIVISIVVIVFLCVISIGILTDKPIDFWGLRFNTREYITKKDTVMVKGLDSATKELPVTGAPSSKTTQKNKSGKKVINLNSGTNNGIQGGDGNVQGKNINTGINNGHIGDLIVGKKLNESDKKEFLMTLEAQKKKYNITSNIVSIGVYDYSNAKNIAIELIEVLESNGYSLGWKYTLHGDDKIQNGIIIGPYGDSTHMYVRVGFFNE